MRFESLKVKIPAKTGHESLKFGQKDVFWSMMLFTI